METTSTGASLSHASEAGAARVEKLSGTAHEAVDKVTAATASTIRELGARGEHLRQHWSDTQDQWITSSRECVRSHPLASVAVAVGVGLLLSRLMSSSSSH